MFASVCFGYTIAILLYGLGWPSLLIDNPRIGLGEVMIGTFVASLAVLAGVGYVIDRKRGKTKMGGYKILLPSLFLVLCLVLLGLAVSGIDTSCAVRWGLL